MRRLISTGSPFEAAYGYSRAVVDGDLVFISGTTGYDYATMTMPHDVAEQTRAIFRTVQTVLTEAGSSLSRIVRCLYFVIDRDYMRAGAESLWRGAARHPPAASIYVVPSLLDREMKVEIEVTARVG